MSEKERKRRNRRTSGWAEADYGAARKFIAYWEARMDRLRVGDVAAELEKMERIALHRAAWFAQAEKVGTTPSKSVTEVFGTMAQHERALAGRLNALRTKLGWCFGHE